MFLLCSNPGCFIPERKSESVKMAAVGEKIMVRGVVSLVIGFALLAGIPATAKPAQHFHKSHAGHWSELERFLRAYVRGEDMPADDDSSYAAAKIAGTDLTVAFRDSQDFCGSSGCTALVLKRQGKSFKVAGTIGLTNRPIRLLPTKHHGMPDFSIFLAGGGYPPAYQASVQFDGKDYGNPSDPPSHKVSRKYGRLLISDRAKLKPLTD